MFWRDIRAVRLKTDAFDANEVKKTKHQQYRLGGQFAESMQSLYVDLSINCWTCLSGSPNRPVCAGCHWVLRTSGLFWRRSTLWHRDFPLRKWWTIPNRHISLDKKTSQLNQKREVISLLVSFSSCFYRLTVVWVSFFSLTKGITPKIYRLCVYVLINKRYFEPFMCLDLVLERWQSFLFQIVLGT